MTIYADVLVGLNFLVTYITIVASRLVLKLPTNKYAVLLAAFLGGLSSLVVFYEEAGMFFSVFYKLTCAAVIVSAGFLPKGLKQFLRCYGVFFLITFLFGGAMLGLSIINPENIMYYNGTVYFNMSLSYLVGSVLSVYGVFIIVNFILEKRAYKNEFCKVRIQFRENIIELTGFVDSGNNLFDGASGRSVIVADLSAISPLFSFEERAFFKNGGYEKIPESLHKAIRLVPAKTINGSGMLTAFLAERVDVFTDKECFPNVYCIVGVSSGSLSQSAYKVILNKHIFNERGEAIINEI